MSYHGLILGGGGVIFAEVYLLAIVSVSFTAGLFVVDLSAESKGAYSS